MTTHGHSENHKESDLMREIGIDMTEISRRMSFIGFTENDRQLLSEMQGFAEKHADRIVTAFYDHLFSFQETRVFLKDPRVVERLLKSQRDYLLELFTGCFDQPYFERRLRTGAVHHRIGLEPKWYISIYSFYENLFSHLIAETYRHERDRGLARDLAVRKIFRIDMVLSLEYYFHRITLDMTTRLKENAREMDDFTRMLSHDLKEPLRGIEAFSSFLLEDYSALLDSQGKRYLNFLKESALQMKALIQDLLTLVSISKRGPKLQWVNLETLLRKVKKDLHFSIDQKKAEIVSLSPLPKIRCDPIQIAEVVKNLISNAIKFNHSTPPRVEISVKENGTLFIFSVKDNGIGIEPEYTDQILLPFERLHPKGVFEGTGVGLAICRKIVEGYGGEIWVESAVGIGSTFFFSLPHEDTEKRP
ncbi:MAG: protoglobin domain-containing protein [Nitrospiria bacterium]